MQVISMKTFENVFLMDSTFEDMTTILFQVFPPGKIQLMVAN